MTWQAATDMVKKNDGFVPDANDPIPQNARTNIVDPKNGKCRYRQLASVGSYDPMDASTWTWDSMENGFPGGAAESTIAPYPAAAALELLTFV